MKEKWKKIFSKDHKLMYAGYVADDKPFGIGTSYYENGNKCQEGIFDDKGLVQGREYYKNGNLRFEGVYTHNKGYGPNYPTFGTCYDEDGNEIYYGELKIKKIGSMGLPRVIVPEEYGFISPRGEPVFETLTWEKDDDKPQGTYYVKLRGKKKRQELVEFLERNGFRCEEDDVTSKESTISSKYPMKVSLDDRTYGHLHNTTCSAAADASRRTIPAEELMFVFECSFAFVIVRAK